MELFIEIGDLNCRFGNFYCDYHTTCQACPEGKGIWKKLVKEVCLWSIQKSIQRPIQSSIPDVWFKTINNETVYCWRFTTLKSYPLWWYLRVKRYNVAPNGTVCRFCWVTAHSDLSTGFTCCASSNELSYSRMLVKKFFTIFSFHMRLMRNWSTEPNVNA